MVHLALELAVGYLKIVTLLKSLGAAVLGIAAVLEGSPFLFEANDLVPGTTMESFVEFPNGQGHEHLIVEDAVVAAVAAGVATSGACSVAWGCQRSGGTDRVRSVRMAVEVEMMVGSTVDRVQMFQLVVVMGEAVCSGMALEVLLPFEPFTFGSDRKLVRRSQV